MKSLFTRIYKYKLKRKEGNNEKRIKIAKEKFLNKFRWNNLRKKVLNIDEDEKTGNFFHLIKNCKRYKLLN